MKIGVGWNDMSRLWKHCRNLTYHASSKHTSMLWRIKEQNDWGTRDFDTKITSTQQVLEYKYSFLHTTCWNLYNGLEYTLNDNSNATKLTASSEKMKKLRIRLTSIFLHLLQALQQLLHNFKFLFQFANIKIRTQLNKNQCLQYKFARKPLSVSQIR